LTKTTNIWRKTTQISEQIGFIVSYWYRSHAEYDYGA